MPILADLELTLRRSIDGYAVEMRFSQPDSEADVRPAQGAPALAGLDFEALRREVDAVQYGRLLGKQLFADPDFKQAFAGARAYSANTGLRLRLFIDVSAPELHAVRWELLRDPADDLCFATSDRVLFSRYLASSDWRHVSRGPQSDLRALIVVANPSDLPDYELEPIPVQERLQRVREALGTIRITPLDSGGQATLSQVGRALHDGYDILYLVCHGRLVDNIPWLWLENENGTTQRVDGRALVERMNGLQAPPRLVVLASCQSGTMTSENSPFSALGPRLAESGVAAVIAMQGSISMHTVDRFMPVLFAELQHDGQIDRAVAVARGAVREQTDSWMPALFMRLRSGSLWYKPGFAGERTIEQWPSIVEYIHQNHEEPEQVWCTPILGGGLLDGLFGPMREISRRLADDFHFPLAPHAREDLPQVAQYFAVMQGRNFPWSKYRDYLRKELLNRLGEQIPEAMRNARLDDLVPVAGKCLREKDALEPHVLLAQLPFPIYVTTSPYSLLEDALVAQNKQPHVEICPWDDESARPVSDAPRDTYIPDVEHPLVYHFFGHWKQPKSLVLTADEYFNYLINMTRYNHLIPESVRSALTNSQLLLLGFQVDDWSFRVLLRNIMTRPGSQSLKGYAHVAVQIDPEESYLAEPQRARKYLESYFQVDVKINVYWGNMRDFMQELLSNWTRSR